MLLKCPECELQVSDKALSCPHCGLPMTKVTKITHKKSKKDHKRLPNGFGQISLLKDRNLRRPYRAMISVGKTPKGKPISKVFGFYETYNDAYSALMEYHKNPYDLDSSIIVSELYDRWTEKYFPTLKSQSSVRTIAGAWSYCEPISTMKVKEVRARHIKACMDSATSANMKSRVKSMCNLMFDFALEYELADKNYARTFSVSDEIIDEMDSQRTKHIPFTEDEMKILWENSNINYVDMVLIQCYTGFRPSELADIRLANVDLEKGVIIGGMKTKAGINRSVPIHSKIYDLVKHRYEEAKDLNSIYLLNCTDARNKNDIRLTYDKYDYRFSKIVELLELNPEHRAHDPRKHFITMAKKAEMDEYAIKYIVGHAIDDITEKVYTERSDDWLIEEIKKIRD